MFEGFETEIENSHLLAAVTDNSKVKLALIEYKELGEFEKKIGKPTLAYLLRPVTTANYIFKQFLLSVQQPDLVDWLNAVGYYRASHAGERFDKARDLLNKSLNGFDRKDEKKSDKGPATPATETKVEAKVEPKVEAKVAAEPLTVLLKRVAETELQGVQKALLEVKDVPPQTLFDPVIDKLSKDTLGKLLDQFSSHALYRKYVQLEHYATLPPNLDKFRIFRVLGRGAFGAVSGVQKKDTHAMFAMKEMSKKKIKHEECERMVVLEQQVLAKMRSPFVLNLRYSFTDPENAYLIFDLCSGGDLKYHMRLKENRRFDEVRARFYAAEVLLGLEHIHSFDIVYRDLKPHNIMLTKTGHVKISDLGLTVQLKPGKEIKHLAGTAGYWSPEVMSRKGTYKMSDYWSFGVFLYEMLYGKLPKCRCNLEAKDKSVEWCPFGDDLQEEDNSIKPDGKLVIKVKYPSEVFSPEAKDLLSRIFVANPQERIGAKGGIDEIKSHPFFKSIDWNRLAAFQAEPPFIPSENKVNAKDVNEVGEFRKSKFHKVTVTEADEKFYENFTFVSQTSLQEELVTSLQKMDDFEKQKASKADSGCCIVL